MPTTTVIESGSGPAVPSIPQRAGTGTTCRDAGGGGQRAPVGDRRTTRPTVRSSLATPRSTFWRLRRAYILQHVGSRVLTLRGSSDDWAIQAAARGTADVHDVAVPAGTPSSRTRQRGRPPIGAAGRAVPRRGPTDPLARAGSRRPRPRAGCSARQEGELSPHRRVERVEQGEAAGQEPQHVRNRSTGSVDAIADGVVVGADVEWHRCRRSGGHHHPRSSSANASRIARGSRARGRRRRRSTAGGDRWSYAAPR